MVSEQVLLEAFRNSLPDSHNREMWVNETYLEYRRLRVLRSCGIRLRPAAGSLMAMLLSIEGDVTEVADEEVGLDAYKKNFGHSPTYCWTVPVSELTQRLASSCNMPGTAWIGGDA
jgi:hypothetical protein